MNDIKNIKYRRALTKIRTSAQSLQIEKEIYCRPVIPREQTICIISTENACDDEIHFLTKCHIHSAEINSLFKQYNDVSKHFKVMPDKDRVRPTNLMKVNGENIVKVAKLF